MNKILLIGNTGQVGQELIQTLNPLGELISLNHQQLDLTQPDNIRNAIASLKPDIIVNAAAYTAVDKAETESELAIKINAEAPKVMAQLAQEISATLVHISTDYVFDGKNCTPYTEEDLTSPLGVYGKSKLLGEAAIQDNCNNYIILRTAWVYGCQGKGNFVKTMLKLGKEREELKVVADQIGTPTWAYDIAEAIASCLKKDHLPQGIFNFTNSGVASWYDFAVAIFEEATQLGIPLKINRVLPITTSEYPTPAQRPAYSVLSKVKFTQTLDIYPPHWRTSLRKMLYQSSVISH